MNRVVFVGGNSEWDWMTGVIEYVHSGISGYHGLHETCGESDTSDPELPGRYVTNFVT